MERRSNAQGSGSDRRRAAPAVAIHTLGQLEPTLPADRQRWANEVPTEIQRLAYVLPTNSHGAGVGVTGANNSPTCHRQGGKACQQLAGTTRTRTPDKPAKWSRGLAS